MRFHVVFICTLFWLNFYRYTLFCLFTLLFYPLTRQNTKVKPLTCSVIRYPRCAAMVAALEGRRAACGADRYEHKPSKQNFKLFKNPEKNHSWVDLGPRSAWEKLSQMLKSPPPVLGATEGENVQTKWRLLSIHTYNSSIRYTKQPMLLLLIQWQWYSGDGVATTAPSCVLRRSTEYHCHWIAIRCGVMFSHTCGKNVKSIVKVVQLFNSS